MADMERKFAPLQRKTPPLKEAPKPRAGESVTWLKPELAAEIAFAEWTREGLLRQAKFKGLREDKDVAQIIKEEAVSQAQAGDCLIEGIKITSPDKTVTEGVTKKDIAQYYQKVASRMLPYVEGRLLSAVRCPGGLGEACFFKKHPDGDKESYYAIEGAAGLLKEVQMNTIEFHTWGSRAESPDNPDVMVFDLDPDEGMDLAAVRQGVRDLKGILDGLGLASYLKTSGGKGYHIYVPLPQTGTGNSEATGLRALSAAKGVAQIMETKWPGRYTTNSRKASRKGKIFVDWLRNTRGATCVAPYSLRKKTGIPVSMPIAWSELDKIAPDGIDMAGALQRLKRKDPWAGFFG